MSTNTKQNYPRIVKKAAREKTAQALILISELGETKYLGGEFLSSEIMHCIKISKASRLLFRSMTDHNLIQKVQHGKYRIHIKRELVNVEMAIKLIKHYNLSVSKYYSKQNITENKPAQKTGKFILIPKSEYLNFTIHDSLESIQNCTPGIAGEYVILNAVSGMKVELKTQIVDMS